ncbi:helix-turn-helix domain-containing protein [Thiocystis violacea]|uniref:helix-turn-helix domain-containing protein n=1 Tax=Thiocystis violacea TaxID=13725 RepID=UPI001906F5AF|nr:helix-turn-helix transcriptional regulator [Thiocystis violacea]
MTDTLNPEALKLHRKLRGGWSQDRLADESKISKTQISRWERGQQVDNIRPSSRERLSKALGVKWEELTRAPKDTLKLRSRVPVKGGIDRAARTFLTIVQWHLDLTEDAIMDLAPLAVLILAERSLRARQTALDETVGELEAATAEACRRLPYLPGAFHDGYRYDWIEEERKSLRERELFVTYEDDEGEEHSPFINFLQDDLKALGLFEEHPIEFTASYSGATPDYAVPTYVFGANLGLDPDNKADQSTLERIQDGLIDLSEVWEKKQSADVEEYRRWLEEQSQAVAEMTAMRIKMPGFKVKTNLPGNHSSQVATDSTADAAPAVENTDTEQRT